MDFNGDTDQYGDQPVMVTAMEWIRLVLVNAGANAYSAVHVVGTIFDRDC